MDNQIQTNPQPNSSVPEVSVIQKYGPLAKQFIRFALIGVVNTGIDFAILNVLMFATGINEGPNLIYLNLISFTAAVANSYFLNKKWAFKDNSQGDTGKKFSAFLAISIIGALINTGIVTGISTYIDPILGLSQGLWVNVAKLLATGVALVWNFIGYKLIVFKDKPTV